MRTKEVFVTNNGGGWVGFDPIEEPLVMPTINFAQDAQDELDRQRMSKTERKSTTVNNAMDDHSPLVIPGLFD